MSGATARDPFALTADTALYVPRLASERALDALVAALEEGGHAVAFTGPAGLGKTLLLHVLAERVRDRWGPIFLPYAALSPEDLASWIRTALGEGEIDQVAALQPGPPGQRERKAHHPLLLVDDAGALPLESARWLGGLAANPDVRVGVVVAASDRAATGSRMAALGGTVSVRLADPMDEHECAEYLRRRLSLADAPLEVRGRFGDATIRRLHAIAGGNPRRLHLAASDLLAGGSGQLPEDAFDGGDEPTIALPELALEDE